MINIRWIFNVSETSMPRVDICYWNNSSNKPLVGPSTVKVRLGPLDRARYFISSCNTQLN